MMTETSVCAAAESSLARIAEREPSLRAWVHLDTAGVRAEAARLDAAGGDLPLRGVTLGVKDIVDVARMPTGCGSPIAAGRIAHQDAALVAELRALGALVVGKTVTTEYAYMSPSPTRNPHDPARSPGGSSSGSAAAVGDGQIDVALGTQTAGSIIRPAAFCGAFGYKPTHGRFSLAGVASLSPSLDTLGFIARDAATAAKVHRALGLADSPTSAGALTFGLVRGPHWGALEPEARALLERAAAVLGAPDSAYDLTPGDAVHFAIMRYEMRRELAAERLQAADLMSAALRELVTQDVVSEAAYRDALAARDRLDLSALFGDVDILIAPPALGEAPAFGTTGDPRCNRVWTLLGLPCVTVPAGTGATGLPLGVQLAARRADDAALFPAAERLSRALAEA